MFAVRVAAFVISVLFLVDAVEPTEGWFIALVVLTGLSILGWGGPPLPVLLLWGALDKGRRGPPPLPDVLRGRPVEQALARPPLAGRPLALALGGLVDRRRLRWTGTDVPSCAPSPLVPNAACGSKTATGR